MAANIIKATLSNIFDEGSLNQQPISDIFSAHCFAGPKDGPASKIKDGF